jgi:hypothetical protein
LAQPSFLASVDCAEIRPIKKDGYVIAYRWRSLEELTDSQVSVNVLAETDRVLAFQHVFPTWDTHIVMIPKTHVRSLADVDDPDLLAELHLVSGRPLSPEYPGAKGELAV